MLVCPQCQFENPDTNKFCQQCGASLTHKSCPECGTQVAYSAQNCQNCGTFTGSVWLAIVSAQSTPASTSTTTPGETGKNVSFTETDATTSVKNDQSQILKNSPWNLASKSSAIATEEPANPGNTSEIQVNWDEKLTSSETNAETSQSSSQVLPLAYLDPQHRYQLLEPELFNSEITTEQQVRVLDIQPLQASPLEMLLYQQSKGQGTELPALEVEQSDRSQTLAQKLNAFFQPPISNPLWQSVPTIAKIYLALESELYPAIPAIHDGWLNDDRPVILLEDRSDWPLLVDLWRDDQIPQMQLLQLLHEMATLWVALAPWHCCQSLLEMNNLRIDEDQSLGLLRLYADSELNVAPQLQDLGQLWQQLFFESGRTLFGQIALLMNDLKEDKIQTIDELRSRLQAIAEEYQGDTQPSSPMPSVEPNNDLSINNPSLGTPVTKEYEADYANLPHGDDNEMPTVVLPMQLLSLEDAGRTDVGRQRRHNEDYFGIHTSLTKVESPLGRNIQARGLYILCDGMGGHAGGEVASALAVKTLSQYFQEHWKHELPDEDCIRQGVLKANQVIYDINQQDARSGSGRMGTTLVMLLVQETQIAVAHVGDSRLYRINRRGIDQLTVDHEVGQREIKRGVEKSIAYSRPDSYQLTQALGPRNEHFVEPDIKFLELNEDTLLLLCSDGLSDNDLIENHWQSSLQPLLSSRANLEQGVIDLIELANQYNGHDNITAVLIRAKVRPDLEQARAANG
ncbi:MAG TPA: serine/threonine phosphatase [Leptolyngbyaceae cyanobacterium]